MTHDRLELLSKRLAGNPEAEKAAETASHEDGAVHVDEGNICGEVRKTLFEVATWSSGSVS